MFGNVLFQVGETKKIIACDNLIDFFFFKYKFFSTEFFSFLRKSKKKKETATSRHDFLKTYTIRRNIFFFSLATSQQLFCPYFQRETSFT